MLTFLRLVVASIVFLAIDPSNSWATDFYVRTSGSDKNDGRSAKSAFQTVDFALSKCSSDDCIYVGAGTYAVNTYRAMPKNSRLEVIGDLKGKQTGDAGRPVFVGQAGRWTMHLYNGKSVVIDGIEFQGAGDGNYYGLSLSGLTSGLSLSNCAFKNSYLATNLNNAGEVSVENCEFDNISHIGLYVTSSRLTARSNRLDNCRYAIYGNDLKKFKVSKSSLQSDGTTSRLALYANNSEVSIESLEIDGYDTAVYSVNSKELSVNSCNFTKVGSWGIYGNGSNCEISEVSVTGKSKSSGYGISYSNTSGSTPKLSDVTCQGIYCGVRSDVSDYKFDNVISKGNQIGYLANNVPVLKLDGARKGRLQLDDNYIGLYVSSSADKPGRLALSNSQISNNDYGLYSNNSSVQIDDCIFKGNSRAVYVLNSPEASVSDCEVLDNNARNTWSHFGIRIDAKKITVTDTKIERNDYGLYLNNLADAAPSLSKLSINDNKDYGLLVIGGKIQLDKKSNVKVSGSNIGLWANNSAVTVDQWEAPSKSNYPYYLTGGTLEMQACSVSGGQIGVYANNLTSASLVKCSLKDQSQHGLYFNLPKKLSLQACSVEASKSHAVYCNAPGLSADSVSINDLSVANSQIAARFIGVPISSGNVKNLVLRANTQGLRVENASLELSPEFSIDASGNQYAVMSYYGKLSSKGYTSEGNAIALYAYQSATELVDTTLTGTSYGAIFYGSNVFADGLDVYSTGYGIYHDPQDKADCRLTIQNSNFTASSIGIRTAGGANSKEVALNNLSISGGTYGLYFSNNKVALDNVRISDVKTYGIYASRSESKLQRAKISKTGSWAIYGAEGSMDVIDSQIYGGQGLLLGTQQSLTANTIVSGTNYGVYLNLKDGQHTVLNSTIAAVKYDGILANLGSVQISNSIIQAGRYGINDVTGLNTVHDYNLITAGSKPFRNTFVSKNEILKQPMFANAPAGDYRLSSGSPAINAGRDMSAYIKTDIVGAKRGSYGRFELGAYEYMEKEGSLRILDWDETAE